MTASCIPHSVLRISLRYEKFVLFLLHDHIAAFVDSFGKLAPLLEGTIIFAPLLQFALNFFVIDIADVNNCKNLQKKIFKEFSE